LARDELRHELEAFVEASQYVQHQSTVMNRLAQISQCISHALHLAAVIVNGESALGEGAKLSIEKHGAGLTVVEELLFNAEPCCPGGDAVALVDDVQKVGGDGVEEPGDDNTVHPGPCRVVEARDVTEDVVLQLESAEDEEDVAAPLAVVG